MTSRPWFFLGAGTILVLLRIYAYLAKRRGRAFFESPRGLSVWSPYQLVVASFLTLFAELAFIRWIAVEIRVFAYFKNLALLLCFVGFGLGCALARQAIRWPVSLKALIGLLLVVRLPWHTYQQIEYTRFYAENGDFARGELKVNHTGYQAIVNLSASFLARHPKLLQEEQSDNPYSIPFRFVGDSPSV